MSEPRIAGEIVEVSAYGAKRPEDHTCAEELDHFLHCLETGETPLIDAVDGARTVVVCCAVTASIAQGRPMAVELDF